jgi:hypothetical protein
MTGLVNDVSVWTKEKNPHQNQQLVMKRMPHRLTGVLDEVVKPVHFIKAKLYKTDFFL